MATSANVVPLPLDQVVVLVRFDRVYGLIKCYPANAQAETLARIARTKTLLPETLLGAHSLGLRVRLDTGDSDLLANFIAGRLS